MTSFIQLPSGKTTVNLTVIAFAEFNEGTPAVPGDPAARNDPNFTPFNPGQPEPAEPATLAVTFTGGAVLVLQDADALALQTALNTNGKGGV